MNSKNNDKDIYAARTLVGIAGGYSAYKYLPVYVKGPYSKLFFNQVQKITPSENVEYWTSAIEAFKKSDTYNDKVEIININKSNWRDIADNYLQKRKQISDKYKNNPIRSLVRKLLEDDEGKLRNHIKGIAHGNNACYLPLTSQVLVNRERMGVTTFHEIGHSINVNDKGLKNILIRSRRFPVVAIPAILGIGLVTPKREEGDEYKDPIGKLSAFIKKYCGLLSGLSMLPVVIEEGIASINGAKLAKGVLNKKMYNKLNKLNTMSFCSYALGAATTAVCTALAVYIKDRVSGTAPVKNRLN